MEESSSKLGLLLTSKNPLKWIKIKPINTSSHTKCKRDFIITNKEKITCIQ